MTVLIFFVMVEAVQVVRGEIAPRRRAHMRHLGMVLPDMAIHGTPCSCGQFRTIRTAISERYLAQPSPFMCDGPAASSASVSIGVAPIASFLGVAPGGGVVVV